MLTLSCPNCGERNVNEFHFGGEYRPRPEPSRELNDSKWASYLYFRENKMGVQKEWWYHNAGCELWFLAERHTQTNLVLKTYIFQFGGELGAE